MQYKIPQNVQREDTIIGPLTLKQMGILAAGGSVAYAVYISLSKTYFMEIWLPPVAIISAITLAFAFLKIHSLPFHIYLMNKLEYHILPQKRTWIQGSGDPIVSYLKEKKKEKKEVRDEKERKIRTERDLEELSKILNREEQ